MYTKDYSALKGKPATDAPDDVPLGPDGLRWKEVVLICPACGHVGLFLEPPDTTSCYGDPAPDCMVCGLGWEDLL